MALKQRALAWSGGIIGILLLLSGLGYCQLTCRNAKDAAIGLLCEGRLTEIHLALWLYHEKYGHFPPAVVLDGQGKPAHSWRVLLLEFLELEAFKKYRFEEKWDSPANAEIAKMMPKCYCSDPDKSSQWVNFVVVQGKGTAFPFEKSTRKNDLKTEPPATLLLVEIAHSDIHWMEPRDLSLDSIPPGAALSDTPISSNRVGGPLALDVNGEKKKLSNKTVIYPLLTISEK